MYANHGAGIWTYKKLHHFSAELEATSPVGRCRQYPPGLGDGEMVEKCQGGFRPQTLVGWWFIVIYSDL